MSGYTDEMRTLFGTEGFYVHCYDCGHEWIAFYLPMQLSFMERFKNICCPKCAGPKVFCGKAPGADKPKEK
jgi:hypothetical protein